MRCAVTQLCETQFCENTRRTLIEIKVTPAAGFSKSSGSSLLLLAMLGGHRSWTYTTGVNDIMKEFVKDRIFVDQLEEHDKEKKTKIKTKKISLAT